MRWIDCARRDKNHDRHGRASCEYQLEQLIGAEGYLQLRQLQGHSQGQFPLPGGARRDIRRASTPLPRFTGQRLPPHVS